ncbi:hypothetical protein DIQ79_04765 [Mycolicibacterium smegmatis]|uniref:Uncharacterized protein n=1 Tax=Mycolicibacterium smegmatis (strain ATCC 700084 / mc(2)155) TaxID=246196 RepID=A0R055_MYCS2|nr:hypothetical protein MSMEG_4266 [Mycolicibacterium smegmatis MC2 155]TBM45269.1 hypothetical protein DIQ86_15480 [Mycolicibacterium smegmatis]TBH51382.1 hypothetical protein EYS45_03280 [Mycolicibacterium smegmatis MC2 155]TBM54771.1 hypothetical protein DIQ85_04875 [Mycolicibacterium smegmatis]TBM66196.1 hypothetical protein DIQ83_04895 [Mycolicibacterium smegmatis]
MGFGPLIYAYPSRLLHRHLRRPRTARIRQCPGNITQPAPPMRSTVPGVE